MKCVSPAQGYGQPQPDKQGHQNQSSTTTKDFEIYQSAWPLKKNCVEWAPFLNFTSTLYVSGISGSMMSLKWWYCQHWQMSLSDLQFGPEVKYVWAIWQHWKNNVFWNEESAYHQLQKHTKQYSTTCSEHYDYYGLPNSADFLPLLGQEAVIIRICFTW